MSPTKKILTKLGFGLALAFGMVLASGAVAAQTLRDSVHGVLARRRRMRSWLAMPRVETYQKGLTLGSFG